MKERIAIIGTSGLFPGSQTPAELWRNLSEGRDCRSEATATDLHADPPLFRGQRGERDKAYCLHGGFVREPAVSAASVGMSVAELAHLDRVQRFALHVSREALSDAGYLARADVLRRCGVVLGSLSFPTEQSNALFLPLYARGLSRAAAVSADGLDLSALDSVRPAPPCALTLKPPAAVVAAQLGLGASHLTLDSACASAFYAIGLASMLLRAGTADLMVAGAVSAADPLFVALGFSIFQAYPEHGTSTPLDRNSQGLSSAEGAGAVVLKRLSDARRDGDHVLATVLGFGWSNDGKGKGPLSPSASGQVLCFERAYRDAAVPVHTIDYVECHATGTALGDRTELAAMERFFVAAGHAPRFGSIKGQVGHLLSAAGMPSLLKVLLGMQHGQVPATPAVREPQSSPEGRLGAAQLVTSATPWPMPGNAHGRRAGLSAFGFGGCNAHLVIEQGIADTESAHAPPMAATAARPERLAITGMALHVGACSELASFDEHSYDAQAIAGELPKERWKGMERELGALTGRADRPAPAGAYLSTFDFDFMKFGVPPNPADRATAQQLLLLKVADAALADAGRVRGGSVAVIVGMGMDLEIHQYEGRVRLGPLIERVLSGADCSATRRSELKQALQDSLCLPGQPNQYASLIGNIMASRVAAHWDFNGPAFTVSAEEDSVFRALEIARLLLAEGEVEAVVVAGIDLAASAEHLLLRAQRGQSSHSPGEAAGAIVIERERDVSARAGSMWACISGLGVSAGRDRASVAAAARDAFAEAAIGPNDVGYVERACPADHELEGLTDAYNSGGALQVALSSSQTLVGDTCAASGIVSLIRAALCLHKRYLPAGAPHAQAQVPGPFYAAPCARAWLRDGAQGPRVAAVSSVGDASFHVVLSEPPSRRSTAKLREALCDHPLKLISVCAPDRVSLSARLNALAERCCDQSDLARLAREQYRDHADGAYAAALIAQSPRELQRELRFLGDALDRGTEREILTPAGSYLTLDPLGRTHPVTFVYPGAFNVYVDAAQDLFRLWPEAFDALSRHTAHGATWLNDPLVTPRSLHRLSKQELADHTRALLAAPIGAFEQGILLSVLYADLMRELFGLRPTSAFGFSMGEISMLYAHGVWSRTDEMSHRLRESPVFRSELAGPMRTLRRAWGEPHPGASTDELWRAYTLVVEPERVLERLAREPYARLVLINSPRSTVIAGAPGACARVISDLGCAAHETALGDLIHCDLVRPQRAALAALHRLPTSSVPELKFFTAVGCRELQIAGTDLGENVAEMYCQPVDFVKLTREVYAAGSRIFVELGPRDSCTRFISETLGELPHLAVATDRQGIGTRRSLLQALAKLSSHRVPVDLSRLYSTPAEPATSARRLLLPVRVGGDRFAEHANQEPDRSETMDIQVDQRAGAVSAFPVAKRAARSDRAANVVWDLQDLTTFAEGNIADVFGPEFSVIDSYRRRVRLPTSEYLLVTRVTDLQATPRRFEPSSITTEYDIPHGAWYASRGQIPWAVAIESGQCDLLLVSYLGIDFENRGERVYRLLDCTLTFLDRLPEEGQTLRYEIHIDSFLRQGDTTLFLFRYECYCAGRHILTMHGGVAGFFSDAELAFGKGIIRSAAQQQVRRTSEKRAFTPLLRCDKRGFGEADLAALCAGDVQRCFGRNSTTPARNPRLAFSSPKMLMLDRISTVDPAGGPWGLGLVIAHKTLAPDHWYFPCHFKDDQVMAGSLMAEGCAQLLRFYAMFLGLDCATTDARFQPLPYDPQRVRCRGQVTPQHGTLTYKMEITDLCGGPRPQAKANVDIELDGKVIVEFQNIGLCLDDEVAATDAWPLHMPRLDVPTSAVRIPDYVPGQYPIRPPPFRPFPGNPLDLQCVPDQLPYTWYHFTEFATGRVANCFGEACACYDNRTPPRTPNTELQLVTRVVSVDGVRHDLQRRASCVAQFDCPADAWFFAENSHPAWMPYSILMEIALQPCGFLSAWVGTTLIVANEDVYFRNLDGTGRLHAEVDPRGKTIHNRATLLNTTRIGSTIIQKFEFELLLDGTLFYSGTAVFGYFEGAALMHQAGLDKGERVAPWHVTSNRALSRVEVREPAVRAGLPGVRQPYLRLAGGRLNFVDFVELDLRGGHSGLGYVYAERRIDMQDWFFACHFHQDPVMPGSLGLEAMLEMLQVFALQRDWERRFKRPRFEHVLTETRWKYRGQITPRDSRMNIDLHVTEVHHTPGCVWLRADATLAKDGLRIYEVSGLQLRIADAEGEG